jgi:hypothetical protein
MRECRTSGSVRGALSNERPYRDYEPHKLQWVLTRESWTHGGPGSWATRRYISTVRRITRASC